MSRIHLQSNSLVLCLSLAAAVAGAMVVGCSSSDDTTDSSAGAAGKTGGTGKAGASAGGSDTAGDTGIGVAGTADSAGGSVEPGGGEGGAAGAPVTSTAGGAATAGSSGTDGLTASIARGKAITDTQSCVTCHQNNYAGSGFYPNITPDEDTGIGDWTTDQIKAAITMGKKNDGSMLCGLMLRYPFTATQVTDVVNFLQSLPAVTNDISKKCPG